jgi:hypothetical protein
MKPLSTYALSAVTLEARLGYPDSMTRISAGDEEEDVVVVKVVSLQSVFPLAMGPEAAVQKARTSVQSSRRRGWDVVLGGFRIVYQIFVMGEWDMV